MRTMLRSTPINSSAEWLAYFTHNRSNRLCFLWEEGVQISESIRAPLIHSLQRFQVGEQGDGANLKRHARRTGDSAYSAAIDLFIQEEQEHSRLLAKLLRELDATLLESHWSDSAFMLLRRLSGLHLEIMTLLIAEIIAKRYYRALAEGIDDPVAQSVFAQIVRDEVGHVAFHCDRLHADFAALPYIVRATMRLIWHSAFRVVCVIVLLDHRNILRAVHVTPRAFLRDCDALFDDTAREIFN